MKNLKGTYTLLEKVIRIVSLLYILVFMPFLFQSIPSTILISSFIVGSLFTYITILKPPSYLPNLNKYFVTALDIAIVITISLLIRSHLNPFHIYLLAVIFSIPKTLKPVPTLIASFLALEISFFSSVSFIDLSLYAIYPSFVSNLGLSIFAALISYVFSLSEHIQTEIYTGSLQQKLIMEEPIPQTTESILHQEYSREVAANIIWRSITVQKEMQSSYSLQTIYQVFLSFLEENSIPSLIVVYFKKPSSVSLIRLNEDKTSLRDITENFSESDYSPPDEFNLNVDSQIHHFSLISDLPEVSVYLTELKEDDFFAYGIAKLTSDLFAYRTAEIALSEKEKILLTRFSSLYEAAKTVSEKLETRPLLEAAAEAVKGLTGMEKSIVLLAEKPEEIKLDSENTIVKGRLVQHPEELWRSSLTKVAGRCIEELRPVLTTVGGGKSILISVPFFFKKKIYGVISGLTSLSRDEVMGDLRTLEVIAALVATSLANLDLMKEREQVAISFERDRIARDMHDSLIQSLFSMLLIVEAAIKNIKRKPETAEEKLANLREELQRTIKEAREYIYELYPHALTDMGLKAAIKRIVSSYESKPAKIHLSIDDLSPEGLPLEIENASLRIIQEALSNAIRHAKASNIYLNIKQRNDGLEITIEDDGKGISPDAEKEVIPGKKGFGIESMQKRVDALKGKITIKSDLNRGTRISAFLPFNPSQEVNDGTHQSNIN